MKRIIYIIVALIVALGIALPVVLPNATQADSGQQITKVPAIGTKVKIGKTEATFLGVDTTTKRWNFKATISTPKTNNSGEVIDCKWYVVGDKYISGKNLFKAEISKDALTLDVNKLFMQPYIFFTYLDGKQVVAQYVKSEIINDYVNSNYSNNILRLTYNVDKYVFYRDLRLIEGVLCEYYNLPSNPNADIYISSNAVGSDTYRISTASGWDANYKTINVGGDWTHKTVKASDLMGAKYPVIIEPSTTYYTNANDGYLENTGAVYATIQSSASSSSLDNSSTQIGVGQNLAGSFYIDRSFVYFDTSDIPDGATVSAGTLSLYGLYDLSDTDFNITIQSGMPTYPHDTLVKDDFDKTFYTNGGGTLTSVGFSTAGYNAITLSATGKTWVNTTGITKFELISSRDISATQPAGNERIYAYSYEKGAGYRPKLDITYTVAAPTNQTDAADDLAHDSATLNGQITATGGENSDLYGFVWGTTSLADPANTAPVATAYDANWTSGAGSYGVGALDHSTGATLLAGTLYYFRFGSHNSGGWSYGSELSFTTIYDCVIDTEPETDVTATSATLVALLSDDGGETCEVRWGYGTTTKLAANFATYDTVTAWAGAYVTGQYPNLPIAGLTPDDDYYFRVQGRNDNGTITSATEGTFHTETTVGTPTNLKGSPSATQIVVTWTKGVGASNTVLVRKVGSAPTTRVDGTTLYTSTGTTYTDTGLLTGITYGYSAWGWDSAAAYSGTYDDEIMTTLAGVSATSTIDMTTDIPSHMNDVPVATGLDATPAKIFIDEMYNVTGMPTGIVALIAFMIIAIVLGVMAYAFSNNLMVVGILEIFALGFGYIIGVVNWIMIALVFAIIVLVFILKERAHQ